jgi:hypothetical protein
MGDLEELGAEPDPALRQQQEEAFVYVEHLLVGGNFTPAWRGHLGVLRGMASEAAKFRGLLAMMNRTYRSLRDRKNQEILDLEWKLAEAEAVIILTQHEVEIGSRLWSMLDDYDGSGDAIARMKEMCDNGTLGFRFVITRAGRLAANVKEGES